MIIINYMSNNILLSVLIPSLPERFDVLQNIVNELNKQTLGKNVEIVVFMDNKHRTIGEKRNGLLTISKGTYVSFVDDDDRISDDYIDQILNAINNNPNVDCIVFNAMVSGYTVNEKICKFGVEYSHINMNDAYYRKPNHLSVYKREIAIRHKFCDISYGEDNIWASKASQDIRNQVRIDKILYYYDYVPKPTDWYFTNK